MSDINIIEQLRKNTEVFDNISLTMDALGKLFNIDKSKLTPRLAGFLLDESIEAFTVYQSEYCTITIGLWKKSGALYPDHAHHDSVEYLICKSGKFFVKFHQGSRFISRGECMSIPAGVSHSCLALEDNSSMIGICIPPEAAYKVETTS